ncbi:MAG TPA: hypothetical protein VFE50_11970 [Cyclobacteriaceae bacterium]|nr:hypothetical protein [Cyclobacteriaceae bacterium]
MSVLAFGQTENKNSVQFSYGLSHSRLIDDGYSRNLLFRGTNSKFFLGYARESDDYRFRFSIESSLGTVKSKSENLPSKFYTAQPSLEYSRKAGPGNLYVGPGLKSTNYLIINQPIFDNASLVSLHGLYINVTRDIRNLRLSYALPVAVYDNRVLWNGGASELAFEDLETPLRVFTTNGSFHYFDLSNIQLRADYIKSIGQKADFIAGYQFRYFKHFYSNEITAGLKIHF